MPVVAARRSPRLHSRTGGVDGEHFRRWLKSVTLRGPENLRKLVPDSDIVGFVRTEPEDRMRPADGSQLRPEPFCEVSARCRRFCIERLHGENFPEQSVLEGVRIVALTGKQQQTAAVLADKVRYVLEALF